MTDFVNASFPQTAMFNITANGVSSFSTGTIGRSRGFSIYWEALNFTDGDYIIEILDSDDFGATGIPLAFNQLIVPLVYTETGLDPFGQDDGDFPKYFGLRDLKGNGIKINITAINVTTGADIHVMLLPYTARTPVTENQT